MDNIYIKFGNKSYRKIVGNPMGINCAPLVVDLFLSFNEGNFVTTLSDYNQADNIEACNSTSSYLDDLLNIDNPYFEEMGNQIYPLELQLNLAKTSDTDAHILDYHVSISYGLFPPFMINVTTLILLL